MAGATGEDFERSRNTKQGQQDSCLFAQGLKAQAMQDYGCARLQMLFLMKVKKQTYVNLSGNNETD